MLDHFLEGKIPMLIPRMEDSGLRWICDCRFSIVDLDGDWGSGAEVGCQVQLRVRSGRGTGDGEENF